MALTGLVESKYQLAKAAKSRKSSDMILLRVQAGSRLYGYSTETSDDDYFEVHSEPLLFEKKDKRGQVTVSAVDVKQTIVDGVDTVQMTLSKFLERASSGSHQALDAMFAASPMIDEIAALRANFRAGYEVIPTYIRIITKFAAQEGFRKQRHSLRAMFNLSDMMDTGRYSPELSADRIAFINEKSHLPAVEFQKLLLELSPVDLASELEAAKL